MRPLAAILAESAARHRNLCPRQVLGARMGLYVGALLGLDLPRVDKRLLVIAETDGCLLDGLSAATGCRVGARTLRILDFGKVAATFTDVAAEVSIRLRPWPRARTQARRYAPAARNRWEVMLAGYQVMPPEELFEVQRVHLNASLAAIISRAGQKATCDMCGEEIINGREVSERGATLCRACAGDGYYRSLEVSEEKSPVILPPL